MLTYLFSLTFPPTVPIVFNGDYLAIAAVIALLLIGPLGGLVSIMLCGAHRAAESAWGYPSVSNDQPNMTLTQLETRIGESKLYSDAMPGPISTPWTRSRFR
ncbi:MAG: hypothetical protein M0C28_29635 [Candidatus Moduliflexus flocculans]|nr:hypothetical protein [Candidatus Moduliflexus flocculans]